MSIDEKFLSVRALISEHNTAIGGEGKPGFIDVEKFSVNVKMAGGTTEDRLKRMSYEDILKCLPEFEGGIKPIALAKDVASIFRGKEESKSRPVTNRRASLMTPEELIKAFDPEDPDSSIGKRLRILSKGERFIVFASGRIIDVDTTLKLLDEVKQGFPGREQMKVDGDIKPVYKIGELPDAYADENPLYPGRPLRPDGTCDQTGRSWEGIPLEIRQLVRVAIDVGALKVDIETAHNVIDLALRDDAASQLRIRYQKAAIKFGELHKLGNLPKLRVPMRGRGSGSLRDGKRVILG